MYPTTYRDVIADLLGPHISIRDTALDEAKLNPNGMAACLPTPLTGQKVGKVSFVANFPRSYDNTWFAQLKLLKMRDAARTGHNEVKWKWFASAKNAMNPSVVNRVYVGLGEAVIFMNDLAPFINNVERLLLGNGFEEKTIREHPLLRKFCIERASERLLFYTPLFDLHYFDPAAVNDCYVPIDRGDEMDFNPLTYLEMIKSENGLSPQNVLQFAGESQACFEEMVDPDTCKPIVDNMLHGTRYWTDNMRSQVQTRRLLWATAANRTIDPGNSKVSSAIKVARGEALEKLREMVRYQYGHMVENDFAEYSNTTTDVASHCLDDLQIADLACGYAAELFTTYGGEMGKLCGHFKRVFLNGKPLL